VREEFQHEREVGVSRLLEAVILPLIHALEPIFILPFPDETPKRGHEFRSQCFDAQRAECDFGHIYVDFPDGRRRVTELELATRQSNALKARIKQAAFPVEKDFDTFNFAATPSLPKQKLLELARGGWIDQRENVCLIGSAGTGKTHLATSLGLAACRQGRRVRFFTAATLVTQLEEKQKQYQLDRFLTSLDKADLLICDELGHSCPRYSPAAVANASSGEP